MLDKALQRSVKNDGYVAGVDVGGTKILALISDRCGRVVGRSKILTKVERGGEDVIARIAECVRKAIQQANLDISEVHAVGIGVAGIIDSEAGLVVFAPNLRWSHVPLKAKLEEILRTPVFIANDVSLGTLAEQVLGACKGYKNVVGIFVGTGIGGGIILNGELFNGANGTAGEIGHVIVKAGGPKCACGNRGCLESLASRTAMVRDIRKAILKHGKKSIVPELTGGNLNLVRSKVLAKALEEGDQVTIKALKRSQHYLGIGVASVVTFLNPEIVVLGGGFVEAMGVNFIEGVRAVALAHCLPSTMNNIEVVSTDLGGDAGSVGACVLARQKHERA